MRGDASPPRQAIRRSSIAHQRASSYWMSCMRLAMAGLPAARAVSSVTRAPARSASSSSFRNAISSSVATGATSFIPAT